MKTLRMQRLVIGTLVGAVVGTVFAGAGVFVARAADPIKIGFGMALTGPLAANGKMSLVAMQVWEDDINAKGGLLGRHLELLLEDSATDDAVAAAKATKLVEQDHAGIAIE